MGVTATVNDTRVIKSDEVEAGVQKWRVASSDKPTRLRKAKPKRRRRKDARPAEIIDAAFEEFSQHGYAATRLEDVAARAGVARGTIYRYFADKEALFVATMQSCMPAFMDPVDRLIDEYPGSTQELLRFVLSAMYADSVRADLEVLVKILITEGSQFPALAEVYHREVVSRATAFIGRVFARGVARGELRADHARLLPLVSLAPSIMAAVWRLTFDAHEPFTNEEFLEAHIELLLRGLFASSSSQP